MWVKQQAVCILQHSTSHRPSLAISLSLTNLKLKYCIEQCKHARPARASPPVRNSCAVNGQIVCPPSPPPAAANLGSTTTDVELLLRRQCRSRQPQPPKLNKTLGQPTGRNFISLSDSASRKSPRPTSPSACSSTPPLPSPRRLRERPGAAPWDLRGSPQSCPGAAAQPFPPA